MRRISFSKVDRLKELIDEARHSYANKEVAEEKAAKFQGKLDRLTDDLDALLRELLCE